MALPKIDRPIFETKLPSGKDIKYTAFRVKEEKLLLIARESEEGKDMVQAVRQVINNCAVDEIDVDTMPSFDLEYLFVQMRCKSVGETADLFYQHRNGVNTKGEECDHVQNVKVNLNNVETITNPDHSQTLTLNDTYGMKLKYPSLGMVEQLKGKDPVNALIELVSLCIESVYTDEEVFEPESVEEAKEFMEGMGQKELNVVEQFFTTMPKNTLEVKYVCDACGDEEVFKLENLADFF